MNLLGVLEGILFVVGDEGISLNSVCEIMNIEALVEPLSKSLSTINTVARINRTAALIKTISYIAAVTVVCVNIIRLVRE